MLILTRKEGESIYIGHSIKITVIEVNNNQIRLAFDCPKEIPIMREELRNTIAKENNMAQNVNTQDCDKLKRLWSNVNDRSKKPIWQFSSSKK